MKKILFFFSLFLLNQTSWATHIAGGNISWEYIGNDQYVFTLIIYDKCSVPANPPTNTVTINSNSPAGSINLNFIGKTDITPVCADPSSAISCLNSSLTSISAIEKYIYTSSPVTITGTPPPSGWEFAWTHCCRSFGNENIPNPTSHRFYLNSKIFSVDGQVFKGNSAQWQDETAHLSLGEGFFNGAASHPIEVDSIDYELIDPYATATTTVPFNPGYSSISPFPDSTEFSVNKGVKLDRATGLFTCDIDSAVISTNFEYSSYVYAYVARGWVRGQLAYEVIQDASLYFGYPNGNNNLPTAQIDTAVFDLYRNGNLYYKEIYPGDSIYFEFSAQDLDLNPPSFALQNLTFEISSSVFDTTYYAASTNKPHVSPVAPQTGFTSAATNNISFSWKPDINNLFGKDHHDYYFYLKMEDDACPIPLQNIAVVHVKVKSVANIEADTITICPGNSAYALTNTPVPAWYPSSLVNDSTLANPLIKANTSGYLYLTDVQYGGKDSVYINIINSNVFNLVDQGAYLEVIDSLGASLLNWYHNGIYFNHAYDTLHPFATGDYQVKGIVNGCELWSDTVTVTNVQRVSVINSNNGSASGNAVELAGSIGFNFSLQVVAGYQFNTISLLGLTQGSGKKVGHDSIRITVYDDQQNIVFQKDTLLTNLQSEVIEIPAGFVTGPGDFTFSLEADSAIALYLVENVQTPYSVALSLFPIEVKGLVEGAADTFPNQPGQYLPSVVFDISITVGLEENNTGIRVYPNPVNHSITVESYKSIEKISLSDLNGKPVIVKWTANSKGYWADLSELPPGVYLLRMVENDITTIKKVVKQ